MRSFNVPNALTVARLLLAPAVAFLLIDAGKSPSMAAAGVFLVAVTTDLLDGYLARTTHRITRFGQIVDPLADKALIGSALIPLTAFDRFPVWALATIVTREVAVSGLRAVQLRRGVVIPASTLGKMKMETQVAVSLAAMLTSDPSASWLMAGAALAAAATAVSGVAYFALAIRGRPRTSASLPAPLSPFPPGEHAKL